MLFVDAKYVNLLSTRLRNFKQKKDYLWNYSCPVCGDSSKDKLKARGYIYRKKSDLFVKCHNCGYGSNIGNLIKHIDSNLYNQYTLERYKEGTSKHKAHKKPENTFELFKDNNTEKLSSGELLEDDLLSSITCIDQLPEDHPAVDYVRKRMIPRTKWSLLYFAPRFKEYVNSITSKFDTPIKGEHPRMVIPYFNPAGKMTAFQGRAYGKEIPKYYTIKINEEEEKIYGLDRIDYSKRIYITEGPLDSLFLPNALAVSGSSFDTPTIRRILSNATIVMDNEPRNREILKQLEKYIDEGYAVCMFPESIEQKDINEMVMAGKSTAEIVEVINTHTHQGMSAKLKFANWRKC